MDRLSNQPIDRSKAEKVAVVAPRRAEAPEKDIETPTLANDLDPPPMDLPEEAVEPEVEE